MKKFTFLGRVLPSRVSIATPRLQRDVSVEAIGLRIILDFDILASDLVAVANVDGDADVPTIHNYVVEAISVILDAAGLMEGVPLFIEMRSVVLPDGQRVGLDPRHQSVRTMLEGLEYEQVLKAIDASPTRLGYALRDLRLALADPATSAMWCYRAIESISRHWVEDKADNDRNGQRWTSLYRALGEDLRSDVVRCKVLADRPRHGHNEALTAQDRDLALAVGWKTVGRYIRFVTSHQAVE